MGQPEKRRVAGASGTFVAAQVYRST